jgi:Protein of unknown function DUF262/HNH endonuclease
MSSVRTYTPLVSNRNTLDVTIETLVQTYAGRVNYQPVYQRDIRWTNIQMGNLIIAIMQRHIIPALHFYKMQDDEIAADSSIELECIDGQHRFFVLNHFMLGTPVELPRKKPFMITMQYKNNDGTITYLFYAKNEHTEAWHRTNPSLNIEYFTVDEQRKFRNFPIHINIYSDNLSLDQRRQIFIGLQSGSPVRGSDLHKNQVDIPLIGLIAENGWERTYKQTMLIRLYTNPESFWIHWFIRLFFLMRGNGSMDDFRVADVNITRMMKDRNERLDITDEETVIFIEVIERFFTFISSLPEKVKFSPCHFYALYIYMLNNTLEDKDKAFVTKWAKSDRDIRTLWVKGDGDCRRKVIIITNLIEKLSSRPTDVSTDEESDSKKKRPSIPKQLKEYLWTRDFGKSIEGKCYCCEKKITLTGQWDAGHIVAHANGGPTTADNLRPVCSPCNKQMGIKNMDDFKNEVIAFKGLNRMLVD